MDFGLYWFENTGFTILLQQGRNYEFQTSSKSDTIYNIPPQREILLTFRFFQRVSIPCYAERCISYSKSVRLSVCLSVTRWH